MSKLVSQLICADRLVLWQSDALQRKKLHLILDLDRTLVLNKNMCLREKEDVKLFRTDFEVHYGSHPIQLRTGLN